MTLPEHKELSESLSVLMVETSRVRSAEVVRIVDALQKLPFVNTRTELVTPENPRGIVKPYWHPSSNLPEPPLPHLDDTFIAVRASLYMGIGTNHFPPEHAPVLEDVRQKLERFLRVTENGVRLSVRADELVKRRHAEDDRVLKHIKAAADTLLKTSDLDAALEGMRTFANLHGMADPVTVVPLATGAMVFRGDEKSTLERIAAVALTPKKHVPNRVAVKMVALRIRKLTGYVAKSNQNTQAFLEHQPKAVVHFLKEPVLDAGWDEFMGWAGSVCADGPNSMRDVRDMVKDLEATARRPEVTKEVLNQAVDLVRVEEVMSS